jgi:hypothetical protein
MALHLRGTKASDGARSEQSRVQVLIDLPVAEGNSLDLRDEGRRSPRKLPSRFLGFISANTRSNVLASKMTAQRISAHHVSGSNAMPSTSGTALPSRRATIRPRYGSLS